MIKILENLDIQPFVECYNNLKDNIIWSEFESGQQAGLQYRPGNDVWTDAVGKPSSKPDSKNTWVQDKVLNEIFKNTVFESVIEKYNITRTRFMWLKPFSCYSIHRDLSERLHIPLITNPDCYFVFKKEGLFHLETGKVYFVDTKKEHTAINCSNQWRLHLLGRVQPNSFYTN